MLLYRIDPAKNMYRWYFIGIQPSLWAPHAVILGWGRLGTNFARWRVIPVEDQAQALALAQKIFLQKRARGYQTPRCAAGNNRSSH